MGHRKITLMAGLLAALAVGITGTASARQFERGLFHPLQIEAVIACGKLAEP